MEVEVAVFVEVGVDGHRHVVTDAQDGSEGVCARTQVCYATQELPACAFFLQGISVVAVAKNLDTCGLNLACLTCCGALHEFAYNAKAGTRRDALQGLFVEVSLVAHNLHVLDGRTIVKGNKEDAFASALRANPSLDVDVASVCCALQSINNFCSFHIIIVLS